MVVKEVRSFFETEKEAYHRDGVLPNVFRVVERTALALQLSLKSVKCLCSSESDELSSVTDPITYQREMEVEMYSGDIYMVYAIISRPFFMLYHHNTSLCRSPVLIRYIFLMPHRNDGRRYKSL